MMKHSVYHNENSVVTPYNQGWERSYTMKEIEDRLQVKQNILIHLCEKRVVIPDLEDAKGRGRVRRFSDFNLFEFAVALEIKAYNINIGFIAVITRILRKYFEGQDLQNNYNLMSFMGDKSLPTVFLVIADAKYAYFTSRAHGNCSGVDFEKLSQEIEQIIPSLDKHGKKTGHNWWQRDNIWEDNRVKDAFAIAAYCPADVESFRSKLEINLHKLVW